MMIFDHAIPYTYLPESDPTLREYLNYNPHHNRYTAKQVASNPALIKVGRKADETDRAGWRGYDRVYSKYLSSKRDEALDILEIGIFFGWSLLAWQRYFKNAKLTGIDNVIDPSRTAEMQEISRRFPVYNTIKKCYFDTRQETDWYELWGKEFDVIIDDGGHHPSNEQLPTLTNGWEYLKPGGLYFIEDVSHRYGELELLALNNKLVELEKEGHEINVYSHDNLGAKMVTKGKYDNTTEYIVVLRKKEHDQISDN